MRALFTFGELLTIFFDFTWGFLAFLASTDSTFCLFSMMLWRYSSAARMLLNVYCCVISLRTPS